MFSFVIPRSLCLRDFVQNEKVNNYCDSRSNGGECENVHVARSLRLSYSFIMILSIFRSGRRLFHVFFFRFYDVLGGAIKVNGIDVRSVKQKSLRGSIGVVPQTASMFNDSIRENLRYGRRNGSQEDLVNAARDAQLLDFIESLDEGWDTVVGDRGLKLSCGEKPRAAVARCLMKDPPLVLLDEATSALDTITENSV